MRGTFFLGDRKFETREMEFAPPGPREVLVRNRVCGVCGTDVHIYLGEQGATDVHPPVVLGHEFSGEVAAVGSAVTAVKAGDRITVDPNHYCGKCDHCLNGKKQMCPEMTGIGVNFNGGFAEYSIVPEAQCIPLGPDVSFEAGALTEPLACCLHGIDRAGIRPGDNVCVVGGGTIGLLMVQLARLSGAAKIVLSEPVAMRREVALRLGADLAADPVRSPLDTQVRAFFGTDGADVVIECVGKPAAISQAIAAAGRGATVLLFSVPSPGQIHELQLQDLFRKELTIRGSFVNPNTHLRAANLLRAGRIQTAPLITHRFPFDRAEEAIRMQMSDESIKVVVVS